MKGNLVTIVKDGKLTNIEEDKLRKDDIVVLQAGEIVPADIKLNETRALEIDEFDLTGEILPVIKTVGGDDGVAYKASRIIKGAGKGIVIATGSQTEYGKVISQGWEQKVPYQFHIFKGKYLGLISLLLPAFIILFNQSAAKGIGITLFLITAVLLVLLQNSEIFKFLLISIEQKKLEHARIQIQDPKLLELLSEIDIVCFDKTGVLTTRQMDVKAIYFADRIVDPNGMRDEQNSFHLVKLACALCHDVFFFEKTELANPIDKALITFADKIGMNVKELLSQYKRVYDQPFDSENRTMACGYEQDDKKSGFCLLALQQHIHRCYSTKW